MVRKTKENERHNMTRKASKGFHIIEFRNTAQQLAWSIIEQHDVVFIVGPAGTSKTHLSVAYAVTEVLAKRMKKIILTRPVVEAGEKLGFLPGTFAEKINPYLMPIFDCMDSMLNVETRERIDQAMEIAPLAYLRGRAEPLGNLLPTPNGLKRMGDICLGDYVFGSNGKKVLVTGVFPQGEKSVYKITFSDKSHVLCSEDHLWSTKTRGKDFSVKSTKEISEYIKTKWGQKNHEIPIISEPVDFNKSETMLHPYLMGVLLGDGCFSKHEAAVTITNTDENLISIIKNVLPSGIELRYNGDISYRLSCGKTKHNLIKDELRRTNLYCLKSHQKFIPDCYKFNSVENRVEILRGLMDTDGWVSNNFKKCRIQHYTTSIKLAEDLKFLIQSLGGISHVRKRSFVDNEQHLYKGKVIRHVKSLYVSEILMPEGLNPFKCSKKANLYNKQPRAKRLISKIDYVGKLPCQCISVDSQDSLYLTENFLVTHNTFYNSVCILDEAQNCKEEQIKMFLTRLGDNSKMIITGDPTQSDLVHNRSLTDIINCMKTVPGIGIVEFNEDSIVRHPLVAGILKAWPK